MSSAALTLTNPKSGVTAAYPFEASKVFLLDLPDIDDSISVLTLSPLLPLAHQGDPQAANLCTKGDCTVLPNDSLTSPTLPTHSTPPAFITKGDVVTPPHDPISHKSYHSFPLSSAVVNYVGSDLVDILQTEHFLVDSGCHQAFSEWGLAASSSPPKHHVKPIAAKVTSHSTVLCYVEGDVSTF